MLFMLLFLVCVVYNVYVYAIISSYMVCCLCCCFQLYNVLFANVALENLFTLRQIIYV